LAQVQADVRIFAGKVGLALERAGRGSDSACFDRHVRPGRRRASRVTPPRAGTRGNKPRSRCLASSSRRGKACRQLAGLAQDAGGVGELAGRTGSTSPRWGSPSCHREARLSASAMNWTRLEHLAVQRDRSGLLRLRRAAVEVGKRRHHSRVVAWAGCEVPGLPGRSGRIGGRQGPQRLVAHSPIVEAVSTSTSRPLGSGRTGLRQNGETLAKQGLVSGGPSGQVARTDPPRRRTPPLFPLRKCSSRPLTTEHGLPAQRAVPGRLTEAVHRANSDEETAVPQVQLKVHRRTYHAVTDRKMRTDRIFGTRASVM
jgi:hypothetical protein